MNIRAKAPFGLRLPSDPARVLRAGLRLGVGLSVASFAALYTSLLVFFFRDFAEELSRAAKTIAAPGSATPDDLEDLGFVLAISIAFLGGALLFFGFAWRAIRSLPLGTWAELRVALVLLSGVASFLLASFLTPPLGPRFAEYGGTPAFLLGAAAIYYRFRIPIAVRLLPQSECAKMSDRFSESFAGWFALMVWSSLLRVLHGVLPESMPGAFLLGFAASAAVASCSAYWLTRIPVPRWNPPPPPSPPDGSLPPAVGGGE